MKYNTKVLSKKVRSRVARRKRNRYHNDAALFPDTSDSFIKVILPTAKQSETTKDS